MLLLGNNIEKLLINSLILSASVVSLHPGMIPVGIQWFTTNDNSAVFHGKQCAIASETNLSKGRRLSYNSILLNDLNLHSSQDGNVLSTVWQEWCPRRRSVRPVRAIHDVWGAGVPSCCACFHRFSCWHFVLLLSTERFNYFSLNSLKTINIFT